MKLLRRLKNYISHTKTTFKEKINITDSLNEEIDKPCFIYLWTSSCCMLGCGHISLELPNGEYISFWPADGTGCWDILYKKCNYRYYASLWDEVEETGYPDKVKEIFNLNVNAITQWWNIFKKENPKYDVWARNCASVVLIALGKGNKSFLNACKLKTPRGVFELVEEEFNENKKCTLNCKRFVQYVLLFCIAHCLRTTYWTCIAIQQCCSKSPCRRKKGIRVSYTKCIGIGDDWNNLDENLVWDITYTKTLKAVHD